ncbi:hypothetical protein [Micrococcus luteus]|uniref:hypothetical protein n=1 Tax=Micrococcus luteus TaxID=1270 RepID=UPI002303C64E|nr:hypothetical protein [Micrococcus luteus]
MSAYMVEDEHINVMVWAASKKTEHHGTPFAVELSNGRTLRAGTQEQRDELGRFLVQANEASLAARYGDTFPPITYRYQPPIWRTWSALETVWAVECFDYQACEVEDWPQCDAARVCDALRLHLLATALSEASDLSGWGIGENRLPQAEKARGKRAVPTSA